MSKTFTPIDIRNVRFNITQTRIDKEIVRAVVKRDPFGTPNRCVGCKTPLAIGRRVFADSYTGHQGCSVAHVRRYIAAGIIGSAYEHAQSNGRRAPTGDYRKGRDAAIARAFVRYPL